MTIIASWKKNIWKSCLTKKKLYQSAKYNLDKIETTISLKVSDSLDKYKYLTLEVVILPVQQLIIQQKDFKISP